MKKPYELEQAYNAFRAGHTEAQSQAFVEYLGVNFSEERNAPPVFKAYYTTAKSMQQLPAVLQPLVDRDMIHALNRIDDTVNRGCIRYEIGLKNRTNANMAFIDRWIGQLFPEIERHRDEINRLYSIRCVEDERYRAVRRRKPSSCIICCGNAPIRTGSAGRTRWIIPISSWCWPGWKSRSSAGCVI